jgi:hypothetical protein
MMMTPRRRPPTRRDRGHGFFWGPIRYTEVAPDAAPPTKKAATIAPHRARVGGPARSRRSSRCAVRRRRRPPAGRRAFPRIRTRALRRPTRRRRRSRWFREAWGAPDAPTPSRGPRSTCRTPPPRASGARESRAGASPRARGCAVTSASVEETRIVKLVDRHPWSLSLLRGARSRVRRPGVRHAIVRGARS